MFVTWFALLIWRAHATGVLDRTIGVPDARPASEQLCEALALALPMVLACQPAQAFHQDHFASFGERLRRWGLTRLIPHLLYKAGPRVRPSVTRGSRMAWGCLVGQYGITRRAMRTEPLLRSP